MYKYLDLYISIDRDVDRSRYIDLDIHRLLTGKIIRANYINVMVEISVYY